jgi:curli biogenesis system outer membrane secretion channel CsgG
MKRLFTLLTFVILVTSLAAQPRYSIEKYSIDKGEKAKAYNKAAKKLAKNNQFNKTLVNASYALKAAEKKKEISNAQEYLQLYYEDAIYDNLEKIESLKGSSATFSDDNSVTQRAEILNIYTIMNQYCRVLDRLDDSAFDPVKKKDGKLDLEIITYSAEITEAKTSLDESIELAATMHYEKGRELSRNTDLSSSKEAAKRYRWATEYVADYRDAADRYLEAKKLGTTRMGMSNFENASSEFGQVGSAIVNKVLSGLINHKDDFEFFEALDRDQMSRLLEEQKLSLSGLMDESTTTELGNLVGVNVILVGEISKTGVDRQKLDPYFVEYEEEVVLRTEKYKDDDGKEKTRKIMGDVTATVEMNDKMANAVISASFKIIDVATGRVLAAGEIQGSDNWKYSWGSSFTGDERAVPNYINSKEKQYPNEAEMMENAVEVASQKLYREIAKFAREVSE